MARAYGDNIHETTITTGTGSYALLGAMPGKATFASKCANGDYIPYTCMNRDVQGEWESGLGMYVTAGNGLSRLAVYEPINGTATSFTAGTKDIYYGPTAWEWRQVGIQGISTADQAIAAATSALLIGSAIQVPKHGLIVGSAYRAWFSMSKTAAGTAANTFFVRMGVNGTVADTARLTFTMPTATAAVDNALVDLLVTIRGPLTASGRMQGNLMMNHNLASTGFATTPNVIQNVLSATFDLSAGVTPYQWISLSCTTAASTVLTFQQVTAEMFAG